MPLVVIFLFKVKTNFGLLIILPDYSFMYCYAKFGGRCYYSRSADKSVKQIMFCDTTFIQN